MYELFQSLFHKHLRRTVMRYVNLSSILAFRQIASKVNDRFPAYESLVESKILLSHEVINNTLDLLDIENAL